MMLESCALIIFVTSCLPQALPKAVCLFHMALVHGGKLGVLHRLSACVPGLPWLLIMSHIKDRSGVHGQFLSWLSAPSA